MRKGRNIRKITLPTNVKINKSKEKINRPRVNTKSIYNPTQNINTNNLNEINSYFDSERKNYTKLCLTITHIYFSDLIDEMIGYIKNVNGVHDSMNYVTISEDTKYSESLIKKLNSSGINNLRILKVKNAGKDICPKMKVLRDIRNNHKEESYKYVLFLHDKKHGNSNLGRGWRKQLCSDLSSHKALYYGLYTIGINPNVKMIGSERWTFYGTLRGHILGVNPKFKESAVSFFKSVFRRLNISMPNELGFVGGTMFWCDYNILNDFFDDFKLNVAINEMDKEIGNIKDPSFTHTMERIFGYIFTRNNLKIGKL